MKEGASKQDTLVMLRRMKGVSFLAMSCATGVQAQYAVMMLLKVSVSAHTH